jgi:hypothetical protein
VMAETRPTRREIEAAKTANGGWTKAQLAEWGVPWPPPPGWKKRLLGLTTRGDRRAALRGPAPDLRCANKACDRVKDVGKAFCRPCAAAFLMGVSTGKIEILSRAPAPTED